MGDRGTRSEALGFNSMQPGKVKRGDLLFLVLGVVLIAAAVAAVFLWVRW
jgi:hypothetical protein